MAVAVFTDPSGLVTHIVKTDGANADADLKVHTDALRPGHTFLRIDDAQYAAMKHDDLVAAVELTTGLPAFAKTPPPPPDIPSAKETAARQAFRAAFNASIAKGDTQAVAIMAGWKALSDSLAASAAPAI